MEKRFSQQFFVSANEANAQGELSAHILVTNIIDVATRHANALHIGNPDMTDTDGGWVLSRLTIEMSEWPKVNTHYRLTTWIESYNRHFSERAFRIDDADGNTLGYSRTIWMVIDTKTHTNLGLSHLSLDPSLLDGEAVPIARQTRHIPILTADDAPTQRPSLTATEGVRKYRFKYCDIDFYRHVNTVRYVVLLLNQFSLSLMDASQVHRLELSFMHEARYDMVVDILCHRDADAYTFTLSEPSTHSAPLLFARIALTARRSEEQCY